MNANKIVDEQAKSVEQIEQAVDEKTEEILQNLHKDSDPRLDVTRPLERKLSLTPPAQSNERNTDNKTSSKDESDGKDGGTAPEVTDAPKDIRGAKVDKPTRKEIRHLIREDVQFKAREKLKANQPSILNKLEIPMVAILNLGLAYVLGYFNIAIGYLFALITCVIYIYSRRVRAFTALLTAQVRLDANRKRIDNHFESCEWINEIVGRIWSVYEPVLSSQIFDQVNVVLGDACPPFLNSLHLETLSLGSEAPKLIGAKTYADTARDIVHMDVDILFVPKMTNPDSFIYPLQQTSVLEYPTKIVLVARVGTGRLGVNVPVAVQGISVAAKARIELALMPGIPVVRVAELCLREQPKVDFILKPLKSLDIMDMPGLSHFLISTIQSVVGSLMVDPNRITINLDEIVNMARMKAQKSLGVLHIVLYRAVIPKGSDVSGIVDPFVIIDIDGKQVGKAEVQMDNPAPVWNQQFFVLIRDWNSSVEFKVFHLGGALKKHRLLGSAFHSLKNYEDLPNEEIESLDEHMVSFKNKDTGSSRGEIGFGCTFYKAIEEADLELPITSKYFSGILRLTLHQAKDIVFKGSVPRPMNLYCEILVLDEFDCTEIDDKDIMALRSDTFFKTKIKKSTNSPLWESTYDIFVRDIHSQTILCRIREGAMDLLGVDLGKDPLVGFALYKVEDLLLEEESNDRSLTQFHKVILVKGNASGDLSFSFGFDPIAVDLSSLKTLEAPFRPSVGFVRLLLLEAVNIQPSSSSMLGDSKIYIKMALSGSGELFTTKTTTDLINPVFMNECIEMLKSKRQTILFEVFLSEKFSHDSLIGSYEYSLDTDEPLQDGFIDKWIDVKSNTLRGKENFVCAKIHFQAVIGLLSEIPTTPQAEAVSLGKESQDHNTLNENQSALNITSVEAAKQGPAPEANCSIKSNCGILEIKILATENLAKPMFIVGKHLDFTTVSTYLNHESEAILDLPILLKDDAIIKLTLKEGKDLSAITGKILESVTFQLNEALSMTTMSLGRFKMLVSWEYKALPVYLEPWQVFPKPLLLKLRLIRGCELIAADSSGTSDPYVIVKTNGSRLEKSKTIKKNLNPTWDESFDIYIHDIQKTILTFDVRDWNRIEYSSPLGFANWYPYEHRHGIVETNVDGPPSNPLILNLTNAETGKIEIQCVLMSPAIIPEKRLQIAIEKWKDSTNIHAEKGAILEGTTAIMTGTTKGAINVVTGTATGAANMVQGTANLAAKPFVFAKKGMGGFFSSKEPKADPHMKTIIEDTATPEGITGDTGQEHGAVGPNLSQSEAAMPEGASPPDKSSNLGSSKPGHPGSSHTNREDTPTHPTSIVSKLFRRKSKAI